VTRPHVLYLHGFGSTPKSAKAAALRASLAGGSASFAVPQLDGGDFFSLTMDGIADRAVLAARALPDDGAPLVVVGSSLGGYTAALLAARRALPRLAGLVLIAPAFAFTERWRDQLGESGIAAWRTTGSLPFFHHGAERELPLGSAFLDSCAGLPAIPGDPVVPCAIVHGRSDATVDWRHSRAYADAHEGVELHLVRGDHRLTEPRHEELITWCARDIIARLG
jgi:pimeloyl-ACP methyl ester carboxylesterase